MKRSRSLAMLVAVAVLLTSAAGLAGCATKRQLTDLEAKVDQALSDAQSAKAMSTDAVQRAEAAAVRAEEAATSAENAAQRAEAMANKAEAIFMQKMKK